MKGLSFSEPMVKAWMEGRKTVTRRIMKPQPDVASDGAIYYPHRDHPKWMCYANNSHFRLSLMDDFKPRYLPGETVYIKETWFCDDPAAAQDAMSPGYGVYYKATEEHPSIFPKWKSPRFMPEWASRSHARIVSVRPERVQEITLPELEKEGFTGELNAAFSAFIGLWDSMHGAQNFNVSNPWVWRIELEKLP
jgi:hypothetical protein